MKGHAKVVTNALSRGVPIENTSREPLKGLNDAVVNAVRTTEESKWLKALRDDEEL